MTQPAVMKASAGVTDMAQDVASWMTGSAKAEKGAMYMKLIDGAALYDEVSEIIGNCAHYKLWAVADKISMAPIVDAELVRHAAWRMMATPDDHNIWFVCTACHVSQTKESNYCPDCGARMDGKDETY